MKTTAAEITEAALKLFAENSYRGTSIGDIEKAVGLAPRAGGFYRHFDNKADILLKALDAYEEEINGQVMALADLSLASPQEELRQMTQLFRRHAKRQRHIRIILRSEGRSIPAVRERIFRFNRADAWQVFLEWTRRQLGSATIDDEVRLHTFYIFSTLAMVLYLQDSDEKPLGLDPDIVLAQWQDNSIAYLERMSSLASRRR